MTDLYLYKDKDSLIISGIDKCPEDEPRMARNVDDIHLLTADSPQDAISNNCEFSAKTILFSIQKKRE